MKAIATPGPRMSPKTREILYNAHVVHEKSSRFARE
jgi:hypothetical protein